MKRLLIGLSIFSVAFAMFALLTKKIKRKRLYRKSKKYRNTWVYYE